MDEDFGPLFIKFCSYFPYNAKLCLNGHEYLKRQLAKRGIAFEALDNGTLSCADPALMKRLADGLTAPLIGLFVEQYNRDRMTYDLRRLRLRGLIERIPFTKRYRITDDGLRAALCYHRTYARVLRPTLSVAFEAPARSVSRLNRAIKSFDHEIQRLWEGYGLAA